jgi:uncharacterized peroxidase-related enzyme
MERREQRLVCRRKRMTRIPAIDPLQADSATQERLRAIETAMGKTPNLFKTVAASPTALAVLMQLRDTLAHGTLRIKTRETLALALAEYHSCDYCLSAHAVSSTRAGMDDADVSAARRGTSSDPRNDAAVKFALAVAKSRGSVTDDEFAAIRAAGYDDGQIMEIIANVALNVFTNYVNKIAQTEIDFPRVLSGEPVSP